MQCLYYENDWTITYHYQHSISNQTGNNTKKNLATQTKKQKIHLMVW